VILVRKNLIICIICTHLREAKQDPLKSSSMGLERANGAWFTCSGENLLQICICLSYKEKEVKQFKETSIKILLNCMQHISRLSQIFFHLGIKKHREILIISK